MAKKSKHLAKVNKWISTRNTLIRHCRELVAFSDVFMYFFFYSQLGLVVSSALVTSETTLGLSWNFLLSFTCGEMDRLSELLLIIF